jgi:serine O-acetyltransferase
MSSAFLADIKRCNGTGNARHTLRQLFAENYGLQATLAYRLGRWLLRNRRRIYWWPLLPFGWMAYYLLSRYVRLAFDIHLGLTADIGPGFYIGHFGGLRVRGCRIGANCSVGCLVRIEPAADGRGPVIGDRVWIGAHAQIVGAYRIGSEATVSAGVVVLADIPERALCMGNPAHIIMRNYDNRGILGLKEPQGHDRSPLCSSEGRR